MRLTWVFEGWLRSVAAALAAAFFLCLSLLPAEAASSGEPPSSVQFLSPWEGAVITGGPVVLTGRLPESVPWANFLLNGRPLGAVRQVGSGFFATLEPGEGRNEVEVRYGEERATLTFVYGVELRMNAYVFHAPLLESECKVCHADKAGSPAEGEAELCSKCHPSRRVMFPYVHGPVAAGKCLVCHDPHGSGLQSLTRVETKVMCIMCHDQPSSLKHIETSRSKVCTLCHDPHYSMRPKLIRSSF